MENITLHFLACSREWFINRPEDTLSIWCKIDDIFSGDERLPYWTDIWPASYALAEWLYLKHNCIQGVYCLDLGCGLGFTALVGQHLGAYVLGVDYELEALTYAKNNALNNNISLSTWVVMDWREPALHKHSLSFIWGADIIYEKRSVSSLINFFDHVLAKDGFVWIAEPSRSIYRELYKALCKFGWKCQNVYAQEVKSVQEDSVVVPVNIWEIRR